MQCVILRYDLNGERRGPDTIKLKDQEISFLQAHISQLAQIVQLALPPSKEKVKKKGWSWRFWRKG